MPPRRVQHSNTSNNLSLSPEPSGAPAVRPSPSLPSFTRSASPSGISNFFSRPTKWFSRTASATKPSPTEPRSSTSSVASSSRRRPTISGPSDPRPIEGSGAGPVNGVGGLAALSDKGSRSVLDLSRASVDFNTAADSSSLGDLRAISKKAWSRSADNLASVPHPKLSPLNTTSLEARIEQYRTGTPGSTPVSTNQQKTYPFPSLPVTPSTPPKGSTVHQLRHAHSTSGASISPGSAVASPNTHLAPPSPKQSHPARKRSFDVDRVREKTSSNANTTARSPFPFNFHSNGSNSKSPSPSTPTIVEPTEPVVEDTKRASQIVHRSGLINRLQNFSMSSPQLNSSKNWKAYKMVLKGSKLYFYKPPSDRSAAIKDLFPSELVAVSEEEEQEEEESSSRPGKERDDTRKKRAFWGRRTHPELVLTEGAIERGTLESLVHEAVFGTTFPSCSLIQGGWWSFSSSVLLCIPVLAGQSKFEYEFLRCAAYLVSGAEEAQQDLMRERVSWLASKYIAYHGSAADEEGWKTFVKDVIPSSKSDTIFPKTPRPSRHQTSLSDVSPNLNTFSPRPGEKERTSSLSNNIGLQTPPSRTRVLSPIRSVKSASSKTRVWQALDQEGFTREVFLRLDGEMITQSLILYHRSILESAPSITAGVLLDSSSTSPLLNFFGCDESPNWLTKTVVMQILGPGHVSSRDHQSPNGAGDGRGSLDGKHSAGTHIRSEVISKWAKIGESLRLAGDECSWQAIKAALCSRPIARLEKAWKRVDSHSLAAVRTWAYASPHGQHLTVREPTVSPWGGDKRVKTIGLFAKDANANSGWRYDAMETARQSFTTVQTSFDDCRGNDPRQNVSDEDNIGRLIQLWSESSSSHPKFTRLEQFMSLSFAAEPKKKCLFSPHFWAKAPTIAQFAFTPLQLVEPLPSINLIDRSHLYIQRKPSDIGNLNADQGPTRALELRRVMEANGVIRNNREVKSVDREKSKFDFRGLVLPVFDGELLLYVAAGSDSVTRPSSTIDPDVPPETPPSRSPSIRVKSAAAGLDRKSSRARRASLPALSQRTNRLLTDNAGETTLRAVVRAGTLDALVHFLVHGLDGVTVSVADDNGEMALSDKTTKSVRVDHFEFISIWWNTFRSFVSPYVFFQLLRKEYMTQSISSPTITDEDLIFGFKARLAVIKTIGDWAHNGGGSQDALDDSELYQSVVSFLSQPAERDMASVSSCCPEAQRFCETLEKERTTLLQSFMAQSMRPNARHVQVRGSSSESSVHNFGVKPPLVDEVSVEDFVNNIDAMAAAAFRNLVQEDLFVTADILEVQTIDRTGWYISKDSPSSSDEIEVQTLYTFLMDVEPTNLIAELSGDSLYRLLPPGLRTLIRAFNILRKWAICLISAPQLGLPTRQARMELFLQAIELSRLRSVDNIDSYDDDQAIFQPCVRSFVEAVLTSAILSPESRLFTRAWQNVAAVRNASAESLSSLLSVRTVPTPDPGHRLAVDPAWILDRILDVISLPDVVETSIEMSLSQVNFDKRRQLCSVISNSSFYVTRGSYQRREMDRCDFERLNKIEQEFADANWDMRALRDDAHREALYYRDGSYPTASGKKAVRPFNRSVLQQHEKSKRDKHLRDRLLKEKKLEQQKLERKEEDFNRAMDPRNQTSSGHKQHRSKRSMSALFSLMRPISTAFSLDSAGPAHQPKRSPSDLDFTPSHKPAFVLSMVEARVAVFINNDRSYTFQLDTEDGGHYLLQALNRTDMNQWINTMNTTVRVHAQRRLTYLGNTGQMQFTDNLQQPRPTTASRDPTAVFGVDLEYLVLREANGGDVSPDAVPKVLDLLLAEIEARGLTEQGIYRVAGATTEVTALREALNKGQSYIDKTTDINSVCGVVKYWFRVLPETVIPEYLFDSAVEAAKMTDLDARLSEIRQLVRRLPRAHYAVLRRFAEHLDKVVDYEEKNHMTPDNLATVICPNLLRAPRNDFGLIMKNMGSIIVLFKALITHVNFIFSEDEVEEEEEALEDGDGDLTPGRLPTPDEAEEDEFNVPITSSPEPDEDLQHAMMLASPVSPS